MMYQCGRCGLTRASSQESIGSVLPQCKCPWEFTPPVMQQPQQRTWVGLTGKDKQELAAEQHGWEDLLIAAEAKLKEKNT